MQAISFSDGTGRVYSVVTGSTPQDGVADFISDVCVRACVRACVCSFSLFPSSTTVGWTDER